MGQVGQPCRVTCPSKFRCLLLTILYPQFLLSWSPSISNQRESRIWQAKRSYCIIWIDRLYILTNLANKSLCNNMRDKIECTLFDFWSTCQAKPVTLVKRHLRLLPFTPFFNLPDLYLCAVRHKLILPLLIYYLGFFVVLMAAHVYPVVSSGGSVG